MILIFASASPRRQELLKLFGIPFTVRVADIDETMDPQGSPYEEVGRVSRLKALAVPRENDDVVIAADTIVVCENRVLGKPKTEEEAKAMLSLLSGRDPHHIVEAEFKALARALRDAVEIDPRQQGIPSTKGAL